MPLPGPRVLPTGVSPLNEAIGRFGEGYEHGLDRRKHDDADRLARLLQEAGLANLGVVPDDGTGDPGTPAPSAPPAPAVRQSPAPRPRSPGMAPAPVSGALAGSPAFQQQQQQTDDDSMFAGMDAHGPAVAAATPTPGAWHPETGFAGIPTSRFAPSLIPLEPGFALDPSRTPEARRVQTDIAAENRHAAQDEQSYTTRRTFETDLQAQQRETANLRSFAALRAIAPQHELVTAGYDPNVDYAPEITTARTEGTQRAKELRDGQAAYNLIKQMDPAHPLVAAPFDPTTPTKYSGAISLVGQHQARDETRQDAGEAAYAELRADFPEHQFARAAFDTATPGKYPLALATARGQRQKVATIAPLALSNFARFKAAVPTMEKQDAIMRPFEEQVRANPAAFDGLDAFQAAFYKQPTNFSALHAFESALAQSHIDATNPALAKYLQARATWAVEDMSIQQRGGTEARMDMDQWISSIRPGMDSEGITNVQESRGTRLDGYKAIVPTIDAMLGKATAATAPTGAQAEAAWAQANPPKPGESFEAYHARYLAGGH